MSNNVISTDRLLLREFQPADWRAVLEWCADPEVMRFMLAGEPWTEEQAHAYIREALARANEQPRRTYALAIVLKVNGQVIGGCRLEMLPWDTRVADLGFGLIRRCWGQGYATEAARALVSFGFETLGLHRVFAEPIASNSASVRVLEKIGLRCEGCFREKYWLGEKWWDGLHYAILDHEWRANLKARS